MKWIALTVTFDGPDNVLAEELVANAFYELGLPGVAVAPIGEEPVDGWAKDAVELPTQSSITGYIPENSAASDFVRALKKQLTTLGKNHQIHTQLLMNNIDEEDWAHSWKEFFWPEKVGRHMVVKPTWRTYNANTDDIVIEIDPGMAFGTGTHPTTKMCIQLLETYLQQGDKVLDVGTGSGILMVAAAKLGARSIQGIDNDSMAVTVATDNLTLNKVPRSKYRVVKGNLLNGIKERFNLIVANILSEVILILLDDILTVLGPNGHFIFSGITEENAPKVKRKIVDSGLTVLEMRFEDGWCAIVGKTL